MRGLGERAGLWDFSLFGNLRFALLPLVMMKFIAFEVPPPGAGLVIVTASMPVEAMAAAGMAAVNCVELTNVVVGAVPPEVNH